MTRHSHGLRKGNPLSPFLFVIAIDHLQCIFDRVTDLGSLHQLPAREIRFRNCMYAYDGAIFVAPIKEDIEALSQILVNFCQVTILVTNFQ